MGLREILECPVSGYPAVSVGLILTAFYIILLPFMLFASVPEGPYVAVVGGILVLGSFMVLYNIRRKQWLQFKKAADSLGLRCAPLRLMDAYFMDFRISGEHRGRQVAFRYSFQSLATGAAAAESHYCLVELSGGSIAEFEKSLKVSAWSSKPLTDAGYPVPLAEVFTVPKSSGLYRSVMSMPMEFNMARVRPKDPVLDGEYAFYISPSEKASAAVNEDFGGYLLGVWPKFLGEVVHIYDGFILVRDAGKTVAPDSASVADEISRAVGLASALGESLKGGSPSILARATDRDVWANNIKSMSYIILILAVIFGLILLVCSLFAGFGETAGAVQSIFTYLFTFVERVFLSLSSGN